MNKRRRFGTWDPIRIDEPETNWMHPKRMIEDEDVCDAYGDCHRLAQEWADEMDGERFMTPGGKHSIMVKDDMVYDPVRFGRKKKPMDIDEYLEDTPYEFEAYE